ncbi:SSI family serine proteinase inhibitor [Streptomyces sp. HD]|uniref:SSI family serine proteinase inhibitor n=1 Tax=Streptomyces sp. HD TaxID=3020892 RepID=UPI00232FC26C|nr:SSI family serine proteinase inhibitor [Streptomyces sp. HD]MDC0771641.1 SSI family serine proteinase inhibitor [Streptomyces sp. HD]
MTHSHPRRSLTEHTRAAKAVRAGLSAAAALLVLGTVPALAAAQEPVREPGPTNWLFLTITPGDGGHGDTRGDGGQNGTRGEGGHSRGILLTCDPPQGHDRAVEACAQLAKVDGDISRLQQLQSDNTFCTMIYAPVTAHARGTWGGRSVEYRETFSNSCALAARTGSVFTMDS